MVCAAVSVTVQGTSPGREAPSRAGEGSRYSAGLCTRRRPRSSRCGSRPPAASHPIDTQR